MSNIISFYTVSEVLKFERHLKEENIKVSLMPVPRSLSSSCGTCAKTDKKDLDKIKKIIEENNIEYDQIYSIDS